MQTTLLSFLTLHEARDVKPYSRYMHEHGQVRGREGSLVAFDAVGNPLPKKACSSQTEKKMLKRSLQKRW